ncbi:SNF2 family N-terminal domain containing protein [Hyaloscypha variabilis]
MLPLKRAFVDISSTSESDNLTNVTLDLQQTGSNATLTLPNKTADPALICLGMLSDIVIKLLPTPLSLSEITNAASRPFDNSNYYFELQQEEETGYLACSPGNLVASINIPFSKAIDQILLEIPSVKFDFYVTRQTWSKAFHLQITSKISPISKAGVNVSANASMRMDVGRLLSAQRFYLQRPAYQIPGQMYQNPHYVQFPGIEPRILEDQHKAEVRPEIGNEAEADIQREIDKDDLKNKFAVVLGSLIRSHCLSEFVVDRKIRTSLTTYQKEALDFISQREFGPVQARFSLWKEMMGEYDGKTCYSHVISETKTYDKPVETGGGILADDMGLGKTLTMLANLVATLNDAATFQVSSTSTVEGHLTDEETLCRSRATLVLVPSHMLIKSWTDEIRKFESLVTFRACSLLLIKHRHIYGGLRVCEYHGRGRETRVDAIANADVVLSTYHTVAGESSKTTSPLFKIHWFRIVLDEAHIIRTASTLFFGSVKRLEAKLRWCVTGTPVQNGLEDLGSLVSFLQIPMLDTRLEFKLHIINPLMNKNGSGASSLRVLLDSICLRRLNKLLDLPDVNDFYEEIDFSEAERQQYDTAHMDMSNEIERQVNLEKSKRGLFGILELETRLRRMCNHGTCEISLPKDEVSENYNTSEIIESTICDSCKADLADKIQVDSLCNVHYTTCGHLICSGCLPLFEHALATAKDAKDRVCPLCGQELSGDYLVISRAEAMLGQLGRQLQECSLSFRPDGVSSKINALLKNIHNTNGKDKSIIFSGWTRTLDLIEHHLKKSNINFRRIDGTSSLLARNKTLDEFRKDCKIRILIMTTGTGAVGLNLAVASSVHIFEPQWNPMVESQAVARVVRLGQKKKVSIIRYIVRGTVEQTMRSQQQRKIALADLGWTKNKSSR